ncbi:NPXTG-anchored protein [Oscillospiraceae bacterium MB08-C2-2]|nr:NPXTG-anchored protein [Oscillospiraceae bacterium MB08-C2-2]
MSIGMMVTSFAAEAKLDINDVSQLGSSGVKSTIGSDYQDVLVRAEGEISLPVVNALTTNGVVVNESNLRKAKITIQRTISSGSNVIRDIEFNTKDKITYVRVRFLEEYVSTKATSFSMKIYLAKDGKRSSDYFELSGEMKNEVETVESDRDYVDLSDNLVAEADGYNSKIEVYGGNNVSLITKMMDGKKYYFTVNMDVSSADEKILNKYPDVIVYNLNQVGFTTGAKMVKFDLDGDKYYAYNEKGEAIGTTADLLAFSKKIYLSDKKLDMSGISEVEESDVDASEAPAESSVANNNNNPNTGVNGFANIAVVAGVVALAAAGAVAFKK